MLFLTLDCIIHFSTTDVICKLDIVNFDPLRIYYQSYGLLGRDFHVPFGTLCIRCQSHGLLGRGFCIPFDPLRIYDGWLRSLMQAFPKRNSYFSRTRERVLVLERGGVPCGKHNLHSHGGRHPNFFAHQFGFRQGLRQPHGRLGRGFSRLLWPITYPSSISRSVRKVFPHPYNECFVFLSN